MDDSLELTIPSWDLTVTSESSVSQNPPRKKRKSTPRLDLSGASRGGPEGDSITKKAKYPALPSGLSQASVSPSKKAKSKTKIKSIDENNSPTTKAKPYKEPKRKFPAPEETITSPMNRKRRKSLQVDTDISIDVDETLHAESSPKVKKSSHMKTRSSKKLLQADKSWEMAVEKARGLPEGAESDEEEEETEPAKTGPVITEGFPTKTKVDKKPLNMLQSAAKKLQKIKDSTEGCTGTAGKKRKHAGDNKTESPKKQKLECMSKKDRKKVRKMQQNNFELATRAKKMWEQLRRFDLTPEKRQELSSELYNLIKGQAKELIFAHDTSRVIQCIMKFGAQEHKNALFEELKNDIVEMTKSRYAKFFVRKLLKYGTKAQRNYVFTMLNGNVRKLVKHKEASDIVECAYNDYANASQRNAMVEEFYGPSFTLYKTPENNTLTDVLKTNPDKRDVILRSMKETLSVLVDKTVLQHTIVHRVFLEFFSFATEKLRSEMIETVREGVIHMVHTREGARVAMTTIWYGTPKDRKVVAKTFKTYVKKICLEEYGHLVLLAMFDSVDDTKLVSKVILEELLADVHDIAQDQYGRKVLLYLLRPRDPMHFHPDVVNILKQGDNNPVSKKERAVRQRELAGFVSQPLVKYVEDHCSELVVNNTTLLLLLTIITHAKDPTAAMKAVAGIACEPFAAGSLENFHMVEHTAGHLTLKRLIVNDAERIKAGETVLFSTILLNMLPQGSLKSWAACNRGCFILISLLELDCKEISQKVKKELSPLKQSLSKLNFKGAHILLNKL